MYFLLELKLGNHVIKPSEGVSSCSCGLVASGSVMKLCPLTHMVLRFGQKGALVFASVWKVKGFAVKNFFFTIFV